MVNRATPADHPGGVCRDAATVSVLKDLDAQSRGINKVRMPQHHLSKVGFMAVFGVLAEQLSVGLDQE
jgi:hypothetical protein